MKKTGNYYYEIFSQTKPVRNKEVLEICDNAWSILLEPGEYTTAEYFNNNLPLLELSDLRLEQICNLGGEAVRLTLVRSYNQSDYLTLEYLQTLPVLKYSFFPKDRTYSFSPNSSKYDHLTDGRKLQDINLQLASLAIKSSSS